MKVKLNLTGRISWNVLLFQLNAESCTLRIVIKRSFVTAQLHRLTGAVPRDPSATPASLATRRRSFSARQSGCCCRRPDSRSCATLLRVSGLGAGGRRLGETGEGCVCVCGGGTLAGRSWGKTEGPKPSQRRRRGEMLAGSWGARGRSIRALAGGRLEAGDLGLRGLPSRWEAGRPQEHREYHSERRRLLSGWTPASGWEELGVQRIRGRGWEKICLKKTEKTSFVTLIKGIHQNSRDRSQITVGWIRKGIKTWE